MLILTIRTDKPEAELGLYKNEQQLAYLTWPAHRELAETIHQQIRSILDSQQYLLKDLSGLVVFHGPGSFTGLRIGLSVANALAAGLEIPIIGSGGQDWIAKGLTELLAGHNQKTALPEYGALPNVTIAKK